MLSDTATENKKIPGNISFPGIIAFTGILVVDQLIFTVPAVQLTDLLANLL